MPILANLPAAVTPKNQWACALASLNWNLHRLGRYDNQDGLIINLGAHFPHWAHHCGLMRASDIITALDYLNVGYKRFILADTKADTLSFLTANNTMLVMSFVIHRQPTAHCMGMGGFDGTSVDVMDAALPHAAVTTVPWDDLFNQNQAQVLAFAQ